MHKSEQEEAFDLLDKEQDMKQMSDETDRLILLDPHYVNDQIDFNKNFRKQE